MKCSMTMPWAVQVGFTYLGLLFAVAIAGVGIAATGIVWSSAQQREKEAELLFIGNEFRRAIALYYNRTPGAVKRYPATLEDLIKDSRYLSMQRYLRKVYRDPLTGKAEWGLVRAADGGVKGVHSLAEGRPIKQDRFAAANQAFAYAKRYRDWQFVFEPAQPMTVGTRLGVVSRPFGAK